MRILSRREFLAGLGATAALSPFIPLLDAHGADALFPKRLILFFTPQGTYQRGWVPASVNSPTQFTLGPILAPLAKYQSKINQIAGLKMLPPAYFVAHTPGGVQLWTGSQLDRGAQNADGSYQYGSNTGPSVDQVVAAQVGTSTAYPSLQFGARTGETTIFGGPAKPMYPAEDPQAAFNRLFGTLSTQALSDRASVLDVVNRQLAGLQSRIGAADRAKLDAHLTGVRDLEKRLQSQSAACKGPTLTPSAQDPSGLAAMLDVMVAAMACDRTRVASMQYSQQDNDGDSYPWLGVAAGHHPLTHLTPSDTVDENGNPVTD